MRFLIYMIGYYILTQPNMHYTKIEERRKYDAPLAVPIRIRTVAPILQNSVTNESFYNEESTDWDN